MKNCVLFVLFILFLSSCTVNKPAPIEYHHKKDNISYTNNSGNDNSIIIKDLNHNKKDEYIKPNQVKKTSKIIYHEVREGETIEDIAIKYQKSVDEISMINGLYPPYDLDEFQIIKVK